MVLKSVNEEVGSLFGSVLVTSDDSVLIVPSLTDKHVKSKLADLHVRIAFGIC